MIRVMVADDHEPTRQELVRELGAGGVIQVIAQSETSDETWKVAEKLLPDILLLDTHMPGLLATPDLLKRLSGLRRVKVVVFAGQSKASEVQELLEAGACAYILKTDPVALVRMTILMVSKGSKNVISPSLPRHITRLAAQERMVLRHLTKRGKLPQIAERMGISERELTAVLEHLAGKLELTSTAQVIKWAKKHGF